MYVIAITNAVIGVPNDTLIVTGDSKAPLTSYDHAVRLVHGPGHPEGCDPAVPTVFVFNGCINDYDIYDLLVKQYPNQAEFVKNDVYPASFIVNGHWYDPRFTLMSL